MAIADTDITPESIEALAEAMAEAAAHRQSIELGGRFTKRTMGGPVAAADITISTRKLNRLLKYEPRDLTLSVEAGMRYADIAATLDQHRQMIPLDPPLAAEGTIGGVLAANLSGPRRRLYGTARDMVIGMTFATLTGKLIRTGGMVVKNVAGLDMAKPMIGSFGTLAAIATVNFKLYPKPEATRTWVREFGSAAKAIEARDAVLKSVLQPAAIDIEKTAGGIRLLIQAGGSDKVLGRYASELGASVTVEGEAEEQLWRGIRELAPAFLNAHNNGAVVRISCKLTEIGSVLESVPAPAVARAGSGVVYACFEDAAQAAGRGVIEFAPQSFRERAILWPAPGDAFTLMQRMKHLFDPLGLLNRGRLYGRI